MLHFDIISANVSTLLEVADLLSKQFQNRVWDLRKLGLRTLKAVTQNIDYS